MARPLVSDELWGLVEPLIPEVPRRVGCKNSVRLQIGCFLSFGQGARIAGAGDPSRL